MKRLLLGLSFFTLLICAAAVCGQTMLSKQEYVNQFPTVERLKAEEKGTDEVDTFARFMAALDVINDMMMHDLLMAPNGGMYQMPPAADRVHDWYRIAITKNVIDSPPPQAKDPRYRQLRDKYEADPAFLDSILQRYFTPQFRTDYYGWTRKPMPAVADVKNNAPVVSPSNDPAIIKAKAAKVDLGLFANSIRIGEPLRLPRCTYSTGFTGIPVMGEVTQDCEDTPPPMSGQTADMLNMVTAMITGGAASNSSKSAPGPDPNIRSIALIPDHCLSWMDGNRATVHLASNGTIDRVVILTKGRTMEKRVTEDLIAKYGMAHISESGTVSPASGNTVKLTNSDWILPGLLVEYKVLAIDENGNVQLDGQGYVRIETQTAYDARIAAEKKDKEKKRVL
jgi:hypothetical protein